MVGYDARKETTLSNLGHGFAGSLSGILTRFVSQPLDVLKIRFQLQHEPLIPHSKNYYWNMRQAGFRILREESYRALWKGHLPAQCLSAVYGLAQFRTFEFCTKYIHLNVTVSGKPVTDFLCGGLSGAMGTLASMPFDTVRTRLVGQGEPKIYKGMVQAVTLMVKQEGIFSLYKGLTPSLLQIVPQTGVQFASFRLFTSFYWILLGKDKISKETKLPLVGNLICGSLAGLVAKVVVYPLDLTKKRLQVQGFEEARLHFGRVTKYSGLFHCLRRTVTEEGFRAIYKGLLPSMLKAMVTTGLTFMFYEEICYIFIQTGLFKQK